MPLAGGPTRKRARRAVALATLRVVCANPVRLGVRCRRHRKAERPPRMFARQPRSRMRPPAFEAHLKNGAVAQLGER
jgi:hypothetical protein